MENQENFIENINTLLEKKEFKSIAKMLSELQPVDIAESSNLFSLKERAILFRLLPKDLAAEVFVELDTVNDCLQWLDDFYLKKSKQYDFINDILTLEKMLIDLKKKQNLKSNKNEYKMALHLIFRITQLVNILHQIDLIIALKKLIMLTIKEIISENPPTNSPLRI